MSLRKAHESRSWSLQILWCIVIIRRKIQQKLTWPIQIEKITLKSLTHISHRCLLCVLSNPLYCLFRPTETSDCHYSLYIWTVFRPTHYLILGQNVSWLNNVTFFSFMQVRVLLCSWIGGEKEAISSPQSVKLFLTLDKMKTRSGNFNYGSLWFFIFTWLSSLQVAVSLILLDLWFVLTFCSCFADTSFF